MERVGGQWPLALQYHHEILPHAYLVWPDIINASNYSPTYFTLLFWYTYSACWKYRFARCATASLAHANICSAVRLSASHHVSVRKQAACSVVGRKLSLISPKVASPLSCCLHVILHMGHQVIPLWYLLLCTAPSPRITARIVL